MISADFQRYASRLGADFSGKALVRVGMKRYTTFRIGGFAEVMVFPTDLGELELSIGLAREMELPWRILGSGSNLLVKDGGVNEILINLSRAFSEIDFESDKGAVAMGAGIWLPRAVKQCQNRGMAGLEFAAGIPGTVGGAVIMNAGCHGSCMADVVEWVDWYRPGGGVARTARQELSYSYRRLTRPKDSVVVGCGVALREDDPRAIREKILKGLKWRRHHQPLSYPSAGSVFRNPPGDFAGRLIEEVGLKGAREGDAQISEMHANFIVNRGRARSRDVMALVDRARNEVDKRFGVTMDLEIEIIGEEI